VAFDPLEAFKSDLFLLFFLLLEHIYASGLFEVPRHQPALEAYFLSQGPEIGSCFFFSEMMTRNIAYISLCVRRRRQPTCMHEVQAQDSLFCIFDAHQSFHVLKCSGAMLDIPMETMWIFSCVLHRMAP
jgi:hypothetical protein